MRDHEARWLERGHLWLLAQSESLPVEVYGALWGRWMERLARYETAQGGERGRWWSDPTWRLPVARRNAIREAANAALGTHFALITPGLGGFYPVDQTTQEVLNLE